MADVIKEPEYLCERKHLLETPPPRHLLFLMAFPVVCPTRWWVHASGHSLPWLAAWQDLEPPKRQAFVWAQLAYCVSQTAILSSDFFSLWLYLLLGVGGGGGETRTASCSRVTGSGTNTLHLPQSQVSQRIWEDTLNCTARRGSQRCRRAFQTAVMPQLWQLMRIIISIGFWITVCGQVSGDFCTGLPEVRGPTLNVGMWHQSISWGLRINTKKVSWSSAFVDLCFQTVHPVWPATLDPHSHAFPTFRQAKVENTYWPQIWDHTHFLGTEHKSAWPSNGTSYERQKHGVRIKTK